MEKHKLGYVYIITNPSFREDWVKIGKTSNTVEQRIKDLDGTAIPLPFQIFATVRTSKYSELEKAVHETIDNLTDKRIRQNREFFNITPREALNIIKRLATLLDDAEIKEYQHEKVSYIRSEEERLQLPYEKRKAFWKDFIQYCEDNDGVFASLTPTGENWISKGIRAPYGVNINAVIGYNFARIEIYFGSNDKAQNEMVFDYLYKQKDVIEAEYGAPLVWERLTDKIACRIKDEKEFNPFEMEDTTVVFKFLKDSSDKLSVIFHNHILDFKRGLWHKNEADR